MPNLRGKTWTTTTPANVEDAQYWEDHLLPDNGAPKTVGTLTFKDSDGVSIDTFNGSTNKTITVGGGGHKIEDADGTTMTQQPTLQFLNAEVTNGTNKTIVDCQGEKGDTGASVDVSSSKTGKITTVEFTNADTSAVLDTITIEDGADGENGADGKSLTASHTKSGKTTTVTISDEDGTVIDTFTVTDGTDGTGSGDMAHDDYDDNYVVKNAGGIVDYVASQIPDVSGKADKATTLSGYGISDAYTKTEVNTELANKADKATTLAGYGITDGVKEPTTEGTSGQALVTDGNGGRSWQTVTTDQYITSTSNDFSVSNKKLSLSTSVTSKLTNLDSNGKIDYSNVKNTPTIPTKTSDLTNNSGYITSSSLDSWHKYNGSVEVNTVNVIDTSTQIVFHDINSSKAYDLYFETSDGSMPTLESSALSGTTLTYTVQTKVSGTKFKLREII